MVPIGSTPTRSVRKTEENGPLLISTQAAASWFIGFVRIFTAASYNRYRELFQYFDALQVGLTATPIKYRDMVRNTFKLFGCEDDDPTSNKLWKEFWTGGITNPLTVVEQISFLAFARIEMAPVYGQSKCLNPPAW